MSTTVKVNKDALLDLMKVKEEFDSIIESLELTNDPDFMASYEQAKNQVKNREFVDWNKL